MNTQVAKLIMVWETSPLVISFSSSCTFKPCWRYLVISGYNLPDIEVYTTIHSFYGDTFIVPNMPHDHRKHVSKLEMSHV